MQITCASICYRGYAADELVEALARAPGIGFRTVEIHGPLTSSVAAVSRLNTTQIAGQFAHAGMQCAGIYTPGWGGIDVADVAARARAIAACVRLAATLGADHVTSTGAEQRGTPGALDRIIACVAAVLEQLPSDLPVRLALEPHLGNALEQPDDFAAVLAAIDDQRLGVCADTGHFHAAGVDTEAFIHRFADRLYSVHLKDHIGSISVGIGRGEIDLPSVVAALRSVGYRGDLTLELEVEDPQNLPRYTQEAFLYLSGMLGHKLPADASLKIQD